MIKKFPFQAQLDSVDCAPACLDMITRHYGKNIGMEEIKASFELNTKGSSFEDVQKVASQYCLETMAVKVTVDRFIDDVPLPCIAHWYGNHFVVIYAKNEKHIHIADPAIGKKKITIEEFKKNWLISKDSDEGLLLLVNPTSEFEKLKGNKSESFGIEFLKPYVLPYKKYGVQLMLGLFLASIIQIIMPFLTQKIVDYGINLQDMGFIAVVSIAMVGFYVALTAVEIIRSWILLHITGRINIQLISDFLYKLLELPIAYFDKVSKGSLMNKIDDHHKLRAFFAIDTLEMIFSVFNILVFSIILAYFDTTIFITFLIGTILYFVWVFIHLERRAKHDKALFKAQSVNHTNVVDIFNNAQEIILNGSQNRRREVWKTSQREIFFQNMVGLKILNSQSQGGQLINEIKNAGIIFFAAYATVQGEISLGTMLAIQFIIGSLNVPIKQFTSFMLKLQDAKLAIERLQEIHRNDSESKGDGKSVDDTLMRQDISIDNLKFKYTPDSKTILNGISVVFPVGKTSAIVGVSGAGKTTLLKMLLKFYKASSGNIKIGDKDLKDIDTKTWRENCAVVMQNSVVLNDTIEKNITESRSALKVDLPLLNKALEIANLSSMVDGLTLGIHTKVGVGGIGLSGGERQRLVLARAIYKNTQVLIMDEATSSLDTENEKAIVDNLTEFIMNKTVIVVAHRLSTVKNADQIFVMDDGQIAERGKHDELLNKKGKYFELIKNQI